MPPRPRRPRAGAPRSSASSAVGRSASASDPPRRSRSRSRAPRPRERRRAPPRAAPRSPPSPRRAGLATPCHPPLPTAAEVCTGSADASGRAPRIAATRAGVGRHPVDHGPLGRQVAVDRLGADDDRPRREAASARDADVQQRVERPERQGARRRRGRLDGADAADQAVVAAELAVGGCDERARPASYAIASCGRGSAPRSRSPTARAGVPDELELAADLTAPGSSPCGR